VAAWSLTHVGGMPIAQFCSARGIECGAEERDRISEDVRDSAYHVIESKGATNFAVSLALEHLVGAIMRDSNSILTVSTPLNGQFGIRDIALSVPAIINRGGVRQLLEPALADEELQRLRESARILQGIMAEIEI